MEELLEKVENLKNELNKNEHVLKIQELNEKVKQDKELLGLIEEYNRYPKEELKERIINNKLFREYKLEEAEINYIILDIKSKLKEISRKGSCGK